MCTLTKQARKQEDLSVPKNRNRRNIASVFKSQSTKCKFCCRNRRKIARKSKNKSQKNRCNFFGRGIEIAAFPRFQNRSVFGTLRRRSEQQKQKRAEQYKQTKVSLDCPGIILGLSRNCPDTFLTFSGNFGYVFPFFPHEKRRQHTNKFAPHSFAGQSRKVVYVLLSFCPRTLIWAELNS